MSTQTETKQVIVITPENSVAVAEMPAGDTAEYNFISTAVDGWVECVELREELAGISLWVNEEGKMNNLDYNSLATILWETSYGFTDVIVGTAVVTGGTDETGATLPLTDDQVNIILALVQ
jgi:hypothetical protein